MGLIGYPDTTTSPKKRKATGPQQAPPPPTSQPQYRSPPFSHTGSSIPNTPPTSRRRGHSRQRSDLSGRGAFEPSGRPTSRHRYSEIGGFSTQHITSPPLAGADPGPAPATSLAPPAAPSPEQHHPRSSHPVSSLLEHGEPPRTRSQAPSHVQPPSESYQPAEHPYSAAPELRHGEQRSTPEGDDARRATTSKRDDGRD